MCTAWCVICRSEATNGYDAMRHADVAPQEPQHDTDPDTRHP
jgi:hypothetical protein